MANANVSLQILPQGASDEEVYARVDEAIRVVQASGVKYRVGPMETTMEGDYDQLMAIVKKAQEAAVKAGSSRVLSIIKVDYKPSGVTMQEKTGPYDTDDSR